MGQQTGGQGIGSDHRPGLGQQTLKCLEDAASEHARGVGTAKPKGQAQRETLFREDWRIACNTGGNTGARDKWVREGGAEINPLFPHPKYVMAVNLGPNLR